MVKYIAKQEMYNKIGALLGNLRVNLANTGLQVLRTKQIACSGERWGSNKSEGGRLILNRCRKAMLFWSE